MEHSDGNNNKIYTEILLCVLCTDIQTLPQTGRPRCAQLIRLTASWCLFTYSSTVCAHYTYNRKILLIKLQKLRLKVETEKKTK